MDIIKTYLDNMFASLPKTKDVLKMREDLLVNMKDKYNELKLSGKSENEAIGIVISEFGNIEELAEELGINIYDQKSKEKAITLDEAEEYINASKKNGTMIALGTLLCIISPALLIYLVGNSTNQDLGFSSNLIIGLATLIVLIAIAIGLFIYGGINLAKYSYLKKEVIVPYEVKEVVKIKDSSYNGRFIFSLIAGVMMCVLSPLAIIIFAILNDEKKSEYYNINLGVCILLLMIALGVFLMIRAGIAKDSYNVLLQIGVYKKDKSKSEKIVNSIASIFWPLVVIAYLLWSFLFNAWHISWIIWAIAGVLFGGISGIINANSNQK